MLLNKLYKSLWLNEYHEYLKFNWVKWEIVFQTKKSSYVFIYLEIYLLLKENQI